MDIRYEKGVGNLHIAHAYMDAGFAIIPLSADGKRKPQVQWRRGGVSKWQAGGFFASLGQPHGIAILTGARSGNLEVLDFDQEAPATFARWAADVGPILRHLPVVKTAKGAHVFYRCQEIEPNQALARRPKPADPTASEVLIETRGEGGYVQAAGSPAETHPRNVQYRVIQGDLLHTPTIDPSDRHKLLDAARRLSRWEAPPRPPKPTAPAPEAGAGNRPGDIYNRRATWAEVLEPHGWECREDGWRRPEKYDAGISATTGGEHDTLYVFSTNAAPFCAENAQTTHDQRGNFWIVKPGDSRDTGTTGRRALKVDGISAAVNALTEARKHSFPTSKQWRGTVRVI